MKRFLVMNAENREKIELHASVIRGLLSYHDRFTFPIKSINENPSINLGIDVYREALAYSLKLIEEKLNISTYGGINHDKAKEAWNRRVEE